MVSRRKARELALQMLFQWDIGRHEPAQVVRTFLGGRQLAEETSEFARSLFEGTVAETPTLDPLIAQHAQHWRLDRMAAVDRNLLRLALYELFRHPETPPAVVINEALELARRFSGEESVEFVNGVLDAARKSLPSPEPAT